MLSILDPILGFLASIALLVTMVVLGVDVAIAIATSTLTFGFLSTDKNSFINSVVRGATGFSTINLLFALASALFLASLLRTTGVLDKTMDFFKSLGYRFASVSVPAVVGLIPMPGGALVSAMILKDLYFKVLKLKKDYAAFLNYWFRHVWVPTWPLYQAIIISAAVLNVGVVNIITATFVGSIGAIAAGLLVSYNGLKHIKVPMSDRANINLKFMIEALWPYILVALLVFIVKLDLVTSLIIVIMVLIVYKKPGRKDYTEAFKFAFSPRIISIIFTVMIFREFVGSSGAAQTLYKSLNAYGIPPLAITFLIPFAVSVATSGEYVYPAITFPILISVLGYGTHINNLALLIAYTAGYLGAMLSPVHLCLILTADYYSIPIKSVYRYSVPSAILTLIIAFILGLIMYSGFF